MANVPVKCFYIELSNDIASGDTVRRKVYRQLSLIEESYINKESEN